MVDKSHSTPSTSYECGNFDLFLKCACKKNILLDRRLTMKLMDQVSRHDIIPSFSVSSTQNPRESQHHPIKQSKNRRLSSGLPAFTVVVVVRGPMYLSKLLEIAETLNRYIPSIRSTKAIKSCPQRGNTVYICTRILRPSHGIFLQQSRSSSSIFDPLVTHPRYSCTTARASLEDINSTPPPPPSLHL